MAEPLRFIDHANGRTVYHGFCMFTARRATLYKELLVVIDSDGTPELWSIEGDKGIHALVRYYKEARGRTGMSMFKYNLERHALHSNSETGLKALVG